MTPSPTRNGCAGRRVPGDRRLKAGRSPMGTASFPSGPQGLHPNRAAKPGKDQYGGARARRSSDVPGMFPGRAFHAIWAMPPGRRRTRMRAEQRDRRRHGGHGVAAETGGGSGKAGAKQPPSWPQPPRRTAQGLPAGHLKQNSSEETTMDRYPNIGDHGLIGDLQTAALVTTDGTLDWFCTPRFDSPSVFASLLDAGHGGYYKIVPDRDDYVSKQLYLPDTAILVTRFMTPDGVGEVHDFMRVTGEAATDRHRLVRTIRVVRGTMRFAIEVQPRFDYGRASHKLELTEHGAVFASDDLGLTLHGIAPEGVDARDAGTAVERAGDGLRWTQTLREGQTGGVVLESNGGTPRRVSPEEAQRLADDTQRFWRSWLHRSTYTGRWREMVTRSAMTLKLMTYAPTGALVAAPTTGLPEQAGGERNWDYRYTWIRDGSFSIYALLSLGYTEEAAAFGTWLRDRAA